MNANSYRINPPTHNTYSYGPKPPLSDPKIAHNSLTNPKFQPTASQSSVNQTTSKTTSTSSNSIPHNSTNAQPNINIISSVATNSFLNISVNKRLCCLCKIPVLRRKLKERRYGMNLWRKYLNFPKRQIYPSMHWKAVKEVRQYECWVSSRIGSF